MFGGLPDRWHGSLAAARSWSEVVVSKSIQPLVRQLVGRGDAGAHEGRDVIDALELLPGLLRHRKRQAGDRDAHTRPRPSSADDRGTRNGSIRQISTSTGTTISSADDDQWCAGRGRSKAGRLTVSESTISTSKKLITIQRIENLSCDSTITAANSQSDSAAEIAGPAQQREKRKLSSAQASRNIAGPNQPYSVHAMTPSAARWIAAMRADAQPAGVPAETAPSSRCG